MSDWLVITYMNKVDKLVRYVFKLAYAWNDVRTCMQNFLWHQQKPKLYFNLISLLNLFNFSLHFNFVTRILSTLTNYPTDLLYTQKMISKIDPYHRNFTKCVICLMTFLSLAKDVNGECSTGKCIGGYFFGGVKECDCVWT